MLTACVRSGRWTVCEFCEFSQTVHRALPPGLLHAMAAEAVVAHGVLDPGVGDERGVWSELLEPATEELRAAASHPEDLEAPRLVAPQHPPVRENRLGVSVEQRLDDAGDVDRAPADAKRLPQDDVVQRVRIALDAIAPGDLPADIEEELGDAGVAGEALRGNHLEPLKREVVRRAKADVEDADPRFDEPCIGEIAVVVHHLREDRSERLWEHANIGDRHLPRPSSRQALEPVRVLEPALDGRDVLREVADRKPGHDGYRKSAFGEPSADGVQREDPIGNGVEPLTAEPHEQAAGELQRPLAHEVLPSLVAESLEVSATEAADLDLRRGPVTHDRGERIRAQTRDCLRESEPDIDTQKHELP